MILTFLRKSLFSFDDITRSLPNKRQLGAYVWGFLLFIDLSRSMPLRRERSYQRLGIAKQNVLCPGCSYNETFSVVNA